MIGLCTHLLFGAERRIRAHRRSRHHIAENIYYLVHGKPIKEERPRRTPPAHQLRGNELKF